MKATMKKVLSMVLVIALTAGIAIGGTVAYLTDRDSEANVFTVGDVEIDLNENFEQGATLIPGVKIEKEPTITNTGKNDAWVWATVAIPAVLDNDDASKNVVHFNYYNDHVNEKEWTWMDAGEWLVETKEIDGVKYNVYTVLYQTALKSGDVTSPVIHTVYMDANVDIDPEGNVYVVENGTATSIEWNVNEYGTPVIYVSAYAMQTEGFETVRDAYAAYQTQWGDNGTEWGKPAIVASTADELFAALEKGKSAIASSSAYNVLESTETIAMNAQGATVTLNGDNTGATYHGYLGWVADNVTVSNLNVTGNGFVELGDYSHQGGTKVAENLVIKDLASTLSLSDKGFKIAPAFMQYGHGTLKNCTMTGTTALTDGAVAFDLGLGQGGLVSNTIKGGKYGRVYAWSSSKSTIEGAEIEYLQCAPYNGNLTIKAGTHIGTLCIDYNGYAVWGTAANLEKMIVIEEGAIVDQIVYKDSMLGLTEGPSNWNDQVWNDTLYGTYTQEQWLAGAYKAQ